MRIRSRGEYYGSKKQAISYGGIAMSEYQYFDPDTPLHYHENPYFMYVLKGNMTDLSTYGKRLIPQGSLIFHNWQDPHINEKKSSIAGGFHLELDRSWFEERKLDINLWEGSRILERPHLHHVLGKIFYEFKKQDEFSELAIELLVLQLCEQLESDNTPSIKKEPSWIGRLKEIVHYDTEQLSLNYLSNQLGLHPVHISRAIPIYLDTNLGEYIRQQKIKRAFSHLNDPQLSLSQIAYECGFTDQSHFTRVFKTYFGLTPRRFRQGL